MQSTIRQRRQLEYNSLRRSLSTYRDRRVKLVRCSFAACSCSTDYVDVFSLSPPQRRRGRAAAPDSQSVDHSATASAAEVLESR